MTSSIRNFLLINLLLSVVLITSLSMLANLFLENKDLQHHLDDKLSRSAFAILAFMKKNPDTLELHDIQHQINSISSIQYPFAYRQHTKYFLSPEEAFQFEVLDENNRLILQSALALPSLFLNAAPGLSSNSHNGETWRIFSAIDPSTKIKVIVAEQYDFRNLVAGHVTQESLFVMLMSYPFLGFLIWIIIGRGLSSLQKISTEVQRRAPDRLDPIDTSQVPVEIKAIIEEWNKLFIRLHQAFDREKRFAADAAHELKTPLAALKAHTQVALKAQNDEEREVALHKILAGVDRSAHVIQQLLTLSRMTKDLPEPSKPVNIVKQAKEVIAELASDALEKNSDIELIAPEEEPIIQGHSTAIAILIRNLVDNAIRYTPGGSCIRVVIEDSLNELVLQVIDNGPGIPQHLRQQVFERFFRMLGNKSPGSGLGLGIVQQIVDLHAADIRLETAPGGVGLQVSVVFHKAST